MQNNYNNNTSQVQPSLQKSVNQPQGNQKMIPNTPGSVNNEVRTFQISMPKISIPRIDPKNYNNMQFQNQSQSQPKKS
jgi:hypothetical protein